MGLEGFSKHRLCKMNEVMEGYVERGEVPGLVTAVSRYGETHIHSFGVKTAGTHDSMRQDTIFRIASMTKPVTAVATMILIEDCKLRLDDPIDEFLPELANRQVLRSLESEVDDTVPADRPITLRDLLTFRAGLGLIMARPGTYPIQAAVAQAMGNPGPPKPQSTPPPDEWLRRLGTLPLLHQPGEKWLYHIGSEILGILISRVAGKSLEAFMQERIFGPLGMKDTSFSVPPMKIDRLATQYAKNRQTGEVEVLDPAKGGEWSLPPIFESGGSGLVSTVDDYLAFGQMLIGNGRLGKERILSRASVMLMTTDQLTPEQKSKPGFVKGFFDDQGWGFGLSVQTRRTNLAGTVGRFGWDGGYGTSWAADPDENMQGVLLTQMAWTSPDPPKICKDFWTSAYQAFGE